MLKFSYIKYSMTSFYLLIKMIKIYLKTSVKNMKIKNRLDIINFKQQLLKIIN